MNENENENGVDVGTETGIDRECGRESGTLSESGGRKESLVPSRNGCENHGSHVDCCHRRGDVARGLGCNVVADGDVGGRGRAAA